MHWPNACEFHNSVPALLSPFLGWLAYCFLFQAILQSTFPDSLRGALPVVGGDRDEPLQQDHLRGVRDAGLQPGSSRQPLQHGWVEAFVGVGYDLRCLVKLVDPFQAFFKGYHNPSGSSIYWAHVTPLSCSPNVMAMSFQPVTFQTRSSSFKQSMQLIRQYLFLIAMR